MDDELMLKLVGAIGGDHPSETAEQVLDICMERVLAILADAIEENEPDEDDCASELRKVEVRIRALCG